MQCNSFTRLFEAPNKSMRLQANIPVATIILVNMQFRLTNSQRYLVNAKPGTNHSTNPNGNSER